MPRRPDPDLEKKILDAAQWIWKRGGERALTMRAIARAAGTNTPAVYRRFRDRDDILRALLHRTRLEIAALLETADSPEEGCERYLDFALTHRHEYDSFFQNNYELNYSPRSRRAASRRQGQPARDAMRRKLAARFGGSPRDREALLVSLWMLSHGAAMLLVANSILPQDVKAARAIFTASVKALLQGVPRRSG